MSSFNISIQYSDLSYEKRDELIQYIKELKMEEAKDEGEEFLKNDWHDPQPKTWEEAYVRNYSISHLFWADYEEGDLTDIPNWKELLDDEFENQAEVCLHRALRYTEVEVEI